MVQVMRGKGFILFWTFLLFFGLLTSSEAIVDRIVAVVNQEIITLSEVEKWRPPFQEEVEAGDRLEKRERIQEVRQKVLEQLIEEKLIDQEVKKAGVRVTSKEVEAAIEEVKHRNGINQEELEKALTREGLTIETYRKQIEKGLLRMKLIQLSVKVEPKAGEKELRDFYQKNVDRYRSPESYRPSHILFHIPKGSTQEEVRQIRKRCEKVLEKLKKGENFGEIVLLYSEDASAKDRGDLGFFKKGELLPAFEKEALQLKVGEISGIVRTDFGFHIIKLLDRKGGTPLPFEEVVERAQVDYYEQERQKALKQFLSTLKEKSVIEIKL